MSINVESTTDSEEAVIAAKGSLATNEEQTKEATDESNSEETTASIEETSEDESEVEASDDSTNEESTGEEDEDGEEKIAAKSKSRSGFKRRIDKLTKKASAAEQEAEYWRKEALKRNQDTEKESKIEVEATSEKPDSDLFETHEEYIEALTDWKLEQKISAYEAKQKTHNIQTAAQKKEADFVDKVNVYAESVDDFQDVIEDVDDVPMSLSVKEILLDSDNGPELMYELAKNRDEYEAICQMSPLAAARAIGRFESGLKKTPETKPKLKTTKAPTPLKPVGAKSTGTLSKDPEDMSFQEYKKWRAAK